MERRRTKKGGCMSRVLAQDPAVHRESSVRSVRDAADRLDTPRLKYLRIALVAVGVIFIVGLPLLMIVWPSGWTWHTGHSHYPMMIVGVYATLGVFVLIAARNPLEHLSLIWFAVWSSVVHSGIMAVQALVDPHNHGHFAGDVPALLIVGVALALLTPRRERARIPQQAA